MSNYARVAAVTGANKGIGLAIVRNIALRYPTSPIANGPLLIYLTARDRSRGESALKSLLDDPALREAKVLRRDGGDTDIKYKELDVSDEDSREEMINSMKREHPEGIDALVNNAGITLDGFDSDIVSQTLATNYHGTLGMTQGMLPHIRPNGGRLVNVSSLVCKLQPKYSESLQEAFREVHSIPDLTYLMGAFEWSVANGSCEDDGWPTSAYAVSKTGVSALTRFIAKSKECRARGVLLNSCCPGFINTDMTKGRARKTADEGAKTPVKLAIGDIDDRSGEFWEREEVSNWMGNSNVKFVSSY